MSLTNPHSKNTSVFIEKREDGDVWCSISVDGWVPSNLSASNSISCNVEGTSRMEDQGTEMQFSPLRV